MKVRRSLQLITITIALASCKKPGAESESLPQIMRACDLVRQGKDLSWEEIRTECIAASSNLRALGQMDIHKVAAAAVCVFENASQFEAHTAIDSEHYVAALLRDIADQKSGNGASYRADSDTAVLKPLLILGESWLKMSEDLKSKGANASAPRYSGAIKVFPGPLDDIGKAIVAESERLRALQPLNARLNALDDRLGRLREYIEKSVDRLKTSGNAAAVDSIATACGIPPDRLTELLQ